VKFLKSLPKDKLQKLILVLIVTLIGVGATINFYVAKQFTELHAKREVINKLVTQLTEAQKAVKEELSNTALRDQLHTFVAGQEQHAVEGDAFSWVVREMSLLAERHPVQVTSVNPGGLTTHATKTQYQIYSTRLEVSGSYDDLGKFISDWENTFPTSSIHSMTIVMADPGKARCRVNFEGMMLVRPQVAKAKPASKTDEKKKAA
jgi:hypothetical protein